MRKHVGEKRERQWIMPGKAIFRSAFVFAGATQMCDGGLGVLFCFRIKRTNDQATGILLPFTAQITRCKNARQFEPNLKLGHPQLCKHLGTMEPSRASLDSVG
jgi:hypothetical protein